MKLEYSLDFITEHILSRRDYHNLQAIVNDERARSAQINWETKVAELEKLRSESYMQRWCLWPSNFSYDCKVRARREREKAEFFEEIFLALSGDLIQILTIDDLTKLELV